MKRILIVGEGVTFCHIARPLRLVELLKHKGYDIHFACDPAYKRWIPLNEVTYHPMVSLNPMVFQKRLYWGATLFPTQLVNHYVTDELRLITTLKPDLVIGDFRLSLRLSSAVTGCLYANLTNAHWHPSARMTYDIPSIFPGRFLPHSWLNGIFQKYAAEIMTPQLIPFRKVAQNYNVDFHHEHWGEFMTSGDIRLFADPGEFFPSMVIDNSMVFLGPVTWSDKSERPIDWEKIKQSRKLVILSLGSSGSQRLLDSALHALKHLEVVVAAASSGRTYPWPRWNKPDRLIHFSMLPLKDALPHADLCISHGGTAISHISLEHGCPVVGITNNMDQILSMKPIELLGAGKAIRSEFAYPKTLKTVISSLIENDFTKTRANHLKTLFDPNTLSANLDHFLGQIFE